LTFVLDWPSENMNVLREQPHALDRLELPGLVAMIPNICHGAK
jgi:hypothetical protein